MPNASNAHDSAPYRGSDESRWFPDAAPLAASGKSVIDMLLGGLNGRAFLVLGERVQHEFTHSILCAGVSDGAQQREAATLTIDGVLASREGDVAATSTAALPDGEADQLQAVELSVG